MITQNVELEKNFTSNATAYAIGKWSPWGEKVNGSTSFSNKSRAVILGMIAAAIRVPVIAIPSAGLSAYYGSKTTIYWTKQTRTKTELTGIYVNSKVWTYKNASRTNNLGYKEYTQFKSI